MTRFLRSLGILATALLIAGPGAVWAEDPCADYVPQPKPQNASRDIVGQELDQIMEQGHMLFAVYEDNPPYSWEEKGKPMGVDVEIARLIAESIGVEPRFNFVGAGENLEADLRFNLWKGALIGGRIANVMMRVPYDSKFKCRVEQVVFTGQYAGESIAIAYRKEAYPEEKPVPAYFRFDTVAVENDSIADFYLTQLVGPDNVKRYPTTALAMEALKAGETMAAMGPLAQLEHGLDDTVGVHQPPLVGFAVSKWTLGVGVHFAYRPLSYAVDDAIYAALSDGRIAGIYASYGLTHLAPER
ncbi:transporter substrate-binding domain-containing protein [Primorskyibacter aestuariivivens]|uniref:substrate-binding periplasmic protein n=1 Tax=Primorskyibacter aestuariivivens TaxID=1888912 RepID=UPI0022FFEA16|nr:transporter substrate-binding domain-containing protein [Primorskyibacter aestuariivivens]MDA7428478.1 transporter substrate-binding domain-containing protein [Primorskyibacter aestuariivivens]